MKGNGNKGLQVVQCLPTAGTTLYVTAGDLFTNGIQRYTRDIKDEKDMESFLRALEKRLFP